MTDPWYVVGFMSYTSSPPTSESMRDGGGTDTEWRDTYAPPGHPTTLPDQGPARPPDGAGSSKDASVQDKQGRADGWLSVRFGSVDQTPNPTSP